MKDVPKKKTKKAANLFILLEVFRMGIIIIFEKTVEVYIASRLPPEDEKIRNLNRREGFDKS